MIVTQNYKANVKPYSSCCDMHVNGATCEEGHLAGPKKENVFGWLSAACLLALLANGSVNAQAPLPQIGPRVEPQDVQESLRKTKELLQDPVHVESEFDYIMTARVRILLFWVGKDDVGGGYIRRGTLRRDPTADVIELLIGSDPAKAPRSINRWGAASEILHKGSCCNGGAESSVFFGFMKVSGGTSASEMEKEFAREKQGGAFLFSAIINQGDRNADFAKVVPFSSETDFTIHQFDQAKSMVFDRLLESQGRLKEIGSNEFQVCSRSEGFLETVAELVDAAVAQSDPRRSLCYFYNGDQHEVRLAQVTRVPTETIRLSLRQEPHEYVRTYDDLALAHFEDFNRTSKAESQFELLLGTTGNLKGVPVQIRYQPNWWFQAILNLTTPEPSKEAQNHASH
jgi:hypothetical protein